MKLILILIIIFTTTISANSQKDFKYIASFSDTGQFKVQIDMLLPKDYKLSRAIKNLTLQNSLMKEFDDDFVSYVVDEDISHHLDKEGAYHYSSETKSKKSGFTASLFNKCNVNVKHEVIITSCSLTKSKAPLISKKLINNGKTITKCEGGFNQIKKCRIIFSGQTISINLFVVKRSAPRLALAGASKMIHFFFKHYYRIANNHLAGYKNDNFYVNNLQGLYSELYSYLNEDEKLGESAKVNFYSSSQGYRVDLN